MGLTSEGDLRDGFKRGEDHVNTETEVGVMPLQAEECLESSQKLGETRKDSFLEPSEGAKPGDILFSDSWPPELRQNKLLLF